MDPNVGPPFTINLDLYKSLLEPVGFECTFAEPIAADVSMPKRAGREMLASRSEKMKLTLDDARQLLKVENGAVLGAIKESYLKLMNESKSETNKGAQVPINKSETNNGAQVPITYLLNCAYSRLSHPELGDDVSKYDAEVLYDIPTMKPEAAAFIYL
eukprot:gene9981-7861_t